MFERFTDRARKIMALADQEGQRRNHDYIAPEHILLGLLKEGSGVGAYVLRNMNVKFDDVRHGIDERLAAGTEPVTIGKRPMTPQAKQLIDHAVEEARRINHNYIGSEHLLLGLLRDTDSLSSKVLGSLGVTLDKTREEVLILLSPNGIGTEGTSSRIVPVQLERLKRQLTRQICTEQAVRSIGRFNVGLNESGIRVSYDLHMQFELDEEKLESLDQEAAKLCRNKIADQLDSIAAQLRADAGT